MRRRTRPDIAWYLPKKKRPFAYSTVATRDLLAVLSETCATVREVYDNIHYDVEAKTIAKAFIEKGFGDTPSAQVFHK